MVSMPRRQLDINEIYLTQDVYGFQLSPDGSCWAFVSQSDEIVEADPKHGELGNIIVKPVVDLMIMPATGGYPQPMGLNRLPVSCPQWSPDGQWLAFGGRRGIWVVSPTTGEQNQIATDSVYQLELGEVNSPLRQLEGDTLWADVLWSPDGKYLLYVTEDECNQHIWMIAVDGSERVRLRTVAGRVFSRQWSPDGRHILFTTQEWEDGGKTGGIWTLDVSTHETLRLLHERNGFYLRPLATWTPNGKTIVFRSSRSGYAKLWIMQPDGTDVRQLTSGDHDDSLFRVSPDAKSVAFASRAGQRGGEDIWLLSLKDGETRRLTTQPGLNRPLAWAPDGLSLYFFHTSPVSPGDLWQVDLKDLLSRPITASRPSWLPDLLALPEEMPIPGPGGDVYTLVFKPLDFDPSRKYPAMIWIKGGPTSSSRVAYEPAPRWLANQGYIVACPNYRGSIGFGVSYMEAGAHGNAGKTDLEDIHAVANYVKSLDYVDERRLGITGRSWGGYMTLMAITHYPDLFQCAVAHAAIYNWSVQQAEEDCRQYSHWLYNGWANEKTDFYAERSPITFVDKIKTPLLITHGKADQNVPFVQVESFIAKARAAGVILETKFYEGEGHGNKRTENRRDSYERTLQFLNKHLKPWNYLTNPRKGQRLE